MAEAHSFAGHGDSEPMTSAARSAASGESAPHATYSPDALARLRAALRRGLLPATAAPPAHDDPPSDEADPPGTPFAVSDPLPEHTVYRDEGCHIAPSCLHCPLERCVFDRPAHADAAVRRGRNRRLRTLARRGWPVARLAHQFHLSPAHVRRILRPERTDRSQNGCAHELPPAPGG